ncbi:lipocalin [Oxalobacteraceae bacterium CAVE-383]|nr:lipocalin [Oxalobacteraceae bacterium CAVE-383]
MKRPFKPAALAGIVCGILLALPAAAQQMGAARAVDLSRYAGRWYEIAKFPNDFQKQCIANTIADYRILPDSSIEVVNRCKMASGEINLAVGEARVADKASNAKLQVRFAPAWLSWLPWVWSDYWILELDDAYSVATVGTPNRDYLWILARTPSIPDAEYEKRVDDATKQGFDTSRLVKTHQ